MTTKKLSLLIFIFGFTMAVNGIEMPQQSSFHLKPTPISQSPKPLDIKPNYVYLVDNFSDRSLKDWWKFGNIELESVNSSVGELDPTVQGFSLRLKGKTKDSVIGGFGRYLGLDASQFNAIKMMVKGNKKGEGPAKVILELYVAKDKKWQSAEPDTRAYFLKYEAQYTYTMIVNWEGWRIVTIPFQRFLGTSPRMARTFWNEESQSATGDLVQLQALVLLPQDKGTLDMQISSLSFILDKNFKQNTEKLDF